MDKEEQIKKMAYSICTMGKISEYITDCTKCGYSGEGDCKILKYARKFYENDYRKQSDTVREFVDRIAEFASAMRLLANKEYEESRLVKAMYAQGKIDAVGYMMKEIKKLAKEYGAEVEE